MSPSLCTAADLERAAPAVAPAEEGACPPGVGGPAWGLWGLFRAYKGRILFTYALFSVENLLTLAQPWVLGLAINDLLRGSGRGVALFVAQHLAHLAVGTWRQMYDTRAFTSIYTDLATRLVVEQRRRHVPVSRIAARSALSREFVEFFEYSLPVLLHAVYSVAGALLVLAGYDGVVVACCLALALPAALLNQYYGRQTLALSTRLHDELEREVDVIGAGRPEEVRGHYRRVAGWRVRLSDWAAGNFGVMELFVLGLLAVGLVRSCRSPDVAAGDVYALFRYVLMFVTGLDGVPLLVQRLSRLRDIARRMRADGPGG